MNAGELMHRENGDSYLTVYGRAALMITANCLERILPDAGKDRGSTGCVIDTRRFLP